MLKVLFSKEENKFYPEPIYNGLSSAKEYLQDGLNCYITETIKVEGKLEVLTYMIIFIISIFMLKNIFNYEAMFFITFLSKEFIKPGFSFLIFAISTVSFVTA